VPHTANATSAAAAPALSTAPARWAADIFSFPVMCMLLLGALIFGLCVRGIAEPDIWWHMRNAAYLLQHHAFPSVDTYSFTAAGSPWLDMNGSQKSHFFWASRPWDCEACWWCISPRWC
jgi:hypothetical protein